MMSTKMHVTHAGYRSSLKTEQAAAKRLWVVTSGRNFGRKAGSFAPMQLQGSFENYNQNV